ncbi:MAG: two-component response regulator [Alphaproteobacteria bacterium]|jgi:pilus assembly protein CpaE|nr:two-component response regulator [Alphaproteobacteria bacterium]
MNKLDFENYDIACFTQDDQTSAAFVEAIARLGEIQYKIYAGNVMRAVDYTKSAARAKVLCVDCSQRELLISDVEKLMEFCPPDTNIIILGERNDVSIMRDLMKLNVSDYLVKPVSADILMRSLGQALKLETNDNLTRRKRSGKVILFLGTTGGSGATTLATNTATILAGDMGKKVALIDADFQFGNVRTLLDLPVSHALHDALESPDRIDDLFLEQSMGAYGERLRIISAEEPLHENIDLGSERLANLDPLMELITTKFHYIIIDLCRHHPALWRYFNQYASAVFLVSGLNITSLRDMLRISSVLAEEKDAKTHSVILNHTREKDTINIERFEELFGRKIDVDIPYNAMAAEAADLGVPLVLKSHGYRADIDRIIEIITGVNIRKNQAPFLTKIAKSLMGR